VIKRFRGPKTAITLQLVSRYKQGEDDPRGLHLSAETISLLAELGGDLDNDAVWLVARSSASPPK